MGIDLRRRVVLIAAAAGVALLGVLVVGVLLVSRTDSSQQASLSFSAFTMTYEVRANGVANEVHELVYDSRDSWRDTLVAVPGAPPARSLAGSYQALRDGQLIYHSAVLGGEEVHPASPGLFPHEWLMPAEWSKRRGAAVIADVADTQEHIRREGVHVCADPSSSVASSATAVASVVASATATPAAMGSACGGKAKVTEVRDSYFDRASNVPLLIRDSFDGVVVSEIVVVRLLVDGHEVPLAPAR